MAQSLAKNEGILTGISGGATMWAAVETAKHAPEGSVLVAMLPDTGERYLSTPLFASISAEMNEEELAIARFTTVLLPDAISLPWSYALLFGFRIVSSMSIILVFPNTWFWSLLLILKSC